MVRPSKSQKLWQQIDVRIQAYGPDELRQFFSAAAKFLIDSEYWNDEHPKTEFDKEGVVKAFHQGFVEFSKEGMLAGTSHGGKDTDLIQLLRKASGRGRNNLKRRVAKSKLSMLRSRMQARFQHLMRQESQPLRGLRFYEKVIRKKYLTESMPDKNSVVVLPSQISPEDSRYGRKYRQYSAGKTF
jgi:hypothetical protein